MFYLAFGMNRRMLGPFNTVGEAGTARRVSGDIVVDENGIPCPDESWLWDWERVEPVCYARWCIEMGRIM